MTKLWNWASNRCQNVGRGCSRSALGPVRARRSLASCGVNPLPWSVWRSCSVSVTESACQGWSSREAAMRGPDPLPAVAPGLSDTCESDHCAIVTRSASVCSTSGQQGHERVARQSPDRPPPAGPEGDRGGKGEARLSSPSPARRKELGGGEKQLLKGSLGFPWQQAVRRPRPAGCEQNLSGEARQVLRRLSWPDILAKHLLLAYNHQLP